MIDNHEMFDVQIRDKKLVISLSLIIHRETIVCFETKGWVLIVNFKGCEAWLGNAIAALLHGLMIHEDAPTVYFYHWYPPLWSQLFNTFNAFGFSL